MSLICEMEDGGGQLTTPEENASVESPGEICRVTKVERGSEGRSLVLLQVNCRSICNTVTEFWNLIETYNPEVVTGTESWLNEEINDAEVFRADYITFRRNIRKFSQGGGVFICIKNHIFCRQLWTDEDFEMTAVEIKSRNHKFIWEIAGFYRAPNEDTQFLERLVAHTCCAKNSDKHSIIGGDLNLPHMDWNGNTEGNNLTQALVNRLVWENGFNQVTESPTQGDAILDVYLV